MFGKLSKPLMVVFLLCSGFANATSEGTVHQVIKSKIMGEDRQITVRLPKGYESESDSDVKYPVLYLLDGPGHMDHTAATMEYLNMGGQMPKLIIVGISNTERSRDMTPSVDPKVSFKTGGVDKFLDFIEKELIPHVEKQFPVAGFKLITGHSFGGLTVMHTLATRPNLFQAHFAFSPSVQWGDKETVGRVKKLLSNNKNLENYLYMSIANEGGDMHEGYLEIKELLTKNAPVGLKWNANHYPEETHMTVPVISQFKAYRKYFSDWNVPFEVSKQGLDVVKAAYAKKSAKYGYTILPDEGLINNIGYFFLQREVDLKKAKEYFAYNVKTYPKSANVYDGMADVYEAQGNIKEALVQMDKAVELVKKTQPFYSYMHEHKKRLSELLKK
jgi:predicted alpha/beta superfamily hydrolase